MRLLAAQLPQSGFEDFQAGAAPGLVGEAVPISYGLWVVTVLISYVFVSKCVKTSSEPGTMNLFSTNGIATCLFIIW